MVKLKICTYAPNFIEIWWSAAEISKTFSRWRRPPSWIFEICYLLWLCDLWPRVIVLPRSELRVNRTISDTAPRNDFQDGVRPPHCICCEFIALHPGTEFYISIMVLNYEGDWFSCFGCISMFQLEIAYWHHNLTFWGKQHILAWFRVLWAIKRQNLSRVWPLRCFKNVEIKVRKRYI